MSQKKATTRSILRSTAFNVAVIASIFCLVNMIFLPKADWTRVILETVALLTLAYLELEQLKDATNFKRLKRKTGKLRGKHAKAY